jgi:hypothetical protein
MEIFLFSFNVTLVSAETWTLRKVYQKYMESFEMWCWRWMEKVSWIDHVKNGEHYLGSRWR